MSRLTNPNEISMDYTLSIILAQSLLWIKRSNYLIKKRCVVINLSRSIKRAIWILVDPEDI